MFHPDIERGILGEVSLIGMVGAEIVLVLFTLFFLYYSMSAFLEARSHEFAILLHLGMEKRQMNKLIFFGDNDNWFRLNYRGHYFWLFIFKVFFHDCA